MKPVAAVIAMLEQALAAAKRGEATEAIVLLRHPDGDWDEDYLITDIDDAMVALRTTRIRLGEPRGVTQQ